MPITTQPAPLVFERSATLENQQAAGPTQLSRSDYGSHGKGPQVSSGGGRPSGRGEPSERPERREPTQLGPSDDQRRGERPRRPSATTTELSQEEQSSSSVRYRPPLRAVPSEHASATTEPPLQGHSGPSTTPHRPPAPAEHTASRQDRRDPSAIQYGLRNPSSVPHRPPVPQEHTHAMRELPSSSQQGREPSATTPHWPVLPEQGRDEPIATQSRLELNRRPPIQESPGPIQVTPSDDGPSEQPRGGTTPRGRPRQPEQSGLPEPEPQSGPQCWLLCLRLCCILLALAESEYDTNDSGPPAYDNDSGPPAYVNPPAYVIHQEQSYSTPSVVPDVVPSSQQRTEHLITSSPSSNVSSACDRGNQRIGSTHESGEVHDRHSESSARSNPHTPLSRSTLQYYQPTADQRVSSSSNSTALAVVPPALSSAHANSQSSHHPLPTSERQPSVSTQPRHRPPMSISPQEQSYPTPSVVPQSVQSSHHPPPTPERQPNVSTQPRHRPPMSIRTQHESPNGCCDCCCDCCRDCYNGCCDCCRGCYNGCCDCCRGCYNGCKECCG